MSAYGGASGNKVAEPGMENGSEDMNKGSFNDNLAAKLNLNDESYLYMIQSSILM